MDYESKSREKLLRKRISGALIAAMLILASLLALQFIILFPISIYYYNFDPTGYANEIYNDKINDLFSDIYSVVATIFTGLLPALFLLRKTKKKILSGFTLNYKKIKFPVFYILGGIGVGQLAHIIFYYLLEGISFKSDEVLPTDIKGIIMLFVTTAVLPAIFEEIAFRGIILRSLLPYGKWFAIIVSSVLFGIVHINPLQVVFAASIGIILGYLYAETGALWMSMLLHFANNLLSCFMSYYAIDGSDKANSTTGIVYISLMLIGIGLIFYIIFKKKKNKLEIPKEKRVYFSARYYTKSILANVWTYVFLAASVYTYFIYLQWT